MKKKALIFDMDGVVVHNDRFHYRSWQIFAQKHRKSVSFEEVKSWFGSTNEAILRNLLGTHLTGTEIFNFAREKEQIYRDIYADEIQALQGLREFLSNPDLRDWEIGLATSAPPENVDFVLNKTGLTDYFKTITDDTQISRGKPDPEIFLKTAEKLQVLPENTIVFEDSYHGIEASRRAGMKVIGVATTHAAGQLKNTDAVIEDFSSIKVEDLNKIIENN